MSIIKKIPLGLFIYLLLSIVVFAACAQTDSGFEGADRYYEGLSNAYYPVNERRSMVDGAAVRTLTFSPDGKKEIRIKTLESKLKEYSTSNKAKIAEARAYQCGFSSGRIEGMRLAIRAMASEGKNSRTTNVPPPPNDLIQQENIWRRGWERGFSHGWAESRPRPLGIGNCNCD
ncbi:MAG: hypothetical protein DHS20C16_22010 [Phycisphaerae bacterium]|nr:MAG: hypothetical protein DHS20C16_22010 [Phycisphaerae bacterium]